MQGIRRSHCVLDVCEHAFEHLVEAKRMTNNTIEIRLNNMRFVEAKRPIHIDAATSSR